MPSKFSKKRRRGQKTVDRRVLIAGLGVVVLVVLSSIFLGGQAFKEDKDRYGCLQSHADQAHTVLLVDGSDRFTARHIEALNKVIQHIFDDLEYQHRFSMFVIEGEFVSEGAAVTSSLPERRAFFCMEKRPDEANKLIDGRKFFENRFKKFQRELIEPVYKELQETTISLESPILEMLWEISKNYPDFSPTVKNRRLVIFSDLAQHMPPEFDSCSSRDYPKDFDDFRKTAFYQHMRPELQDVEVTVNYVRRRRTKSSICAHLVQNRGDHIGFWRDLLDDAGASLNPPFFREIRE
jgi:hypothetical protein